MKRAGLIVVALVTPVWLGLAADAAGHRLWVSEGRTNDQLAQDITHLYSVLKIHHLLPTRRYENREGKTVEQVLREQGLFFGPYFPIELDRLMCSLNPRLCRSAIVVSPLNESIEKPIWTNGAGDALVLPDLPLQTYVVPKPYNKRSGESLAHITVDVLHGCEQYDEECATFVHNLNRRTNPDETTGSVILPTRGVRTVLPPLTPEAERSLVPNLVANVRLLKDTPDLPLAVSAVALQSSMFATIHHPFATKESVPDSAIIVAVLDDWVDDQHCGFRRADGDPSGVRAHNVEDHPAGDPVATLPCGARDDSEPPLSEHGTHVAGIIGGRRSTVGIIGINPNSTIVTYQTFIHEIDTELHNHQVADQITNALKKDPIAVFNLSWEYFPDAKATDYLAQRIADLAREILFVVSAGNTTTDLTRVCDVRPACLSQTSSNVISVVALEFDEAGPHVWKEKPGTGSNFGRSLDIAAPGKAVWSTISGNRIGWFSGTSQAAPIVAGAASLLLAKHSKLTPAQVRSRLIYTSDLHENLDSAVTGGVLNVTRALDSDDDLLTFSDGSPPLRGTVMNDSAWRLAYTSRNVGSADTQLVRAADLLRLSKNQGRGTWTMIQRAAGGKLEKLVGILVRNSTYGQIELEDLQGKLHKVNPTAIAEWVTALRLN